MCAGPKYEYRWADGVKVKKPIECSAPKYVDYLMEWVEAQVDDEAGLRFFIFYKRSSSPQALHMVSLTSCVITRGGGVGRNPGASVHLRNRLTLFWGRDISSHRSSTQRWRFHEARFEPSCSWNHPSRHCLIPRRCVGEGWSCFVPGTTRVIKARYLQGARVKAGSGF